LKTSSKQKPSAFEVLSRKSDKLIASLKQLPQSSTTRARISGHVTAKRLARKARSDEVVRGGDVEGIERREARSAEDGERRRLRRKLEPIKKDIFTNVEVLAACWLETGFLEFSEQLVNSVPQLCAAIGGASPEKLPRIRQHLYLAVAAVILKIEAISGPREAA